MHPTDFGLLGLGLALPGLSSRGQGLATESASGATRPGKWAGEIGGPPAAASAGHPPSVPDVAGFLGFWVSLTWRGAELAGTHHPYLFQLNKMILVVLPCPSAPSPSGWAQPRVNQGHAAAPAAG